MKALRRTIVITAVLAPLAAVAVVAVLLSTSDAHLSLSPTALAQLKMPMGGGTVENVQASIAPQTQALPVRMRGLKVWPARKVGVGRDVTVMVTVKRPGWISWLAGKTQRVELTERTPAAGLASDFVTRKGNAPLEVHFTQPVRKFSYATLGSRPVTRKLSRPSTMVSIPESATAGTIKVAGANRGWETAKAVPVSWFPAGAKASAFANPKPGTAITPSTRITVTFSKPVDAVLHDSMPPVTPATSGSWKQLSSHSIRFTPTGYGYGLGAHVKVALPTGVQLVGGEVSASDPSGNWTVPVGSTTRLQQLLAQLGYLPVSFKQQGAAVPDTMAGQEQAAITPPKGSFSWRYANTPSTLESQWAVGSYGELTKGAVMAFESEHDMLADGIAGPVVWKALITAAIKHQTSSFGYTYVYVTEGSPESIDVWHDGKTVVSGPVNTGIAAAPTALGTYAVYEHIPVGTMSGTNPDGSTYHDPGIPDISYFNGGDALHGFIRSSYGFPQSLGCVEMPFSEAASVYPYTPIGTIVQVT